MNKLQKFACKMLGVQEAVQEVAFSGPSSFDGANDNTNRSFIIPYGLDQRSRVTPYSRRRLLEKYNWLRDNVGLIRRMVNGSARYAIGDGIIPKAMTSDSEWNKAHDDWFNTVASNPAVFDFEGRLDYYRGQKSVAVSTMGEGEIFTNCVDAEKLSSEYYLPQFQLLPSHRISDAGPQRVGATPPKTFDGLVLDSTNNRVTAYRCLTGQPTAITGNLQNFTDLDAAHVIHTYDPERVGMLRGITWLYHGINSAVDILDLASLEKQAVKVHSALAVTVKRKGGNTGTGGLTGQLEALLTKTQLQAIQNTTDPQAKNRLLERIFGGGIIPFLNDDEEMELLTSDRPSPVFTGFLDWLVRDIAWGFGVSPEFIWSLSGMGGANTRTILFDSQSFFQSIATMVINNWAAPVRNRIVAAGMLANQGNSSLGIPQCKDPLWQQKVHWQTPAKPTADKGREAVAAMEMLDKGMNTWGDWWGGQGEMGQAKVLERIREVGQALVDIETVRKELGAGGASAALAPEKFNYQMIFPATKPPAAGGSAGGSGTGPSQNQ